jgi:hypothetical protein
MAYRHGKDHQHAKLTPEAVRDIRQNYLAYVRGYRFWAKKYQVSDSTIRDVLSYKSWYRI